MQTNTPIVNALRDYISHNIIRFHMPGHKGSEKAKNQFTDLIGSNIFKVDVTNVPGMDDLHQPVGIIREAEDLAANAFGADRTYFLINGSSCGLQALVMTTCNPGDKILVPRNIHRSILSGIIFSGAVPIYYLPEYFIEFGIPAGTNPDTIQEELLKDPSIKAVLVVNPTYQGIVSDLQRIAAIVHTFDIPLLVDEAHGPHLRFNSKLPISALEHGADGVVHGTHKLLNSLTQSSMLHIHGRRINKERLEATLRILQSTSTSYLLMASLDAARAQWEEQGSVLLEETLHYSHMLRQGVAEISQLKTFGTEVIGRSGIFGLDTTKVTISFRSLGVSGLWMEKALRDKYGIQVEMADFFSILLLITFGNSEKQVRQLLQALESLCAQTAYCRPIEKGYDKIADINMYPDIPELVVTPRDAFISPTVSVPFASTVDMISAEIIACYPPGIPVLSPGEKISSDIIDYLSLMKDMGVHFQGCSDNSLETIRVLK